MTFNISDSRGLFNNAYWSLPLEFQYYLLFPILVLAIKFIGVAGPVCIGWALYHVPSLHFFHFDQTVFVLAYSFCGGVVIAHLYQKMAFRIRAIPGICMLLVLLVCVSFVRMSHYLIPDFPIRFSGWNWYSGLAIAVVLIALFTDFKIQNKLTSFLRHYGEISYSVYLYHNLFVGIAVLILINFDVHNGNYRLYFIFLLTIAGSYLTALVSYRYIERPSITFGKKLLKLKN